MWKRPLKNLKWYDLPKHLKVVLGGANLQKKKKEKWVKKMKVKEKKMRETISKISNLLETKITTHILFIRKHLIKT